MKLDDQLDLFGGARVEPARPSAEVLALAAKLPSGLFLGTSSWSFPGWAGIVWAKEVPEARLARAGLAAYAKHPLLRAVGIDRTHYQPLDAEVFRAYAASVPDGFRFVVKAHEELTLATFPRHARYGARRGQPSARFLDAACARDVVVGPTTEGLGEKLGALLFQFAPQDLSAFGGPEGFAERLFDFLSALPAGVPYAVEVRNPDLLVPAYRDALVAAGASHCINALRGMPPPLEQVKRVQRAVGNRPLVRWLLNPRFTHDEAFRRYSPFTRLVDDEHETRGQIAAICRHALKTGREAMVIANNKAEGSAPLTLFRLAEEVVARLRRP